MELCLLDGTALRWYRRLRELTQVELARLAKVSSRQIIRLENNQQGCKLSNARRLARALEVPVECLIRTVDIHWTRVPGDFTRTQLRLLRTAAYQDMNGNHREAAQICMKLIDENWPHALRWNSQPREYSAVVIKLASFVDNAASHQRALEIIDLWLRKKAEDRPNELKLEELWIKYHRGISLRRLGRFREARAQFKELRSSGDKRFRICSAHQLGVISMEEAIRGNPENPSLREATRLFRQCLQEWDEALGGGRENTHRRGYPLCRLGEIHALRGESAKAIEYYAEALSVFAWHRCLRYAEMAKDHIKKLARRVA